MQGVFWCAALVNEDSLHLTRIQSHRQSVSVHTSDSLAARVRHRYNVSDGDFALFMHEGHVAVAFLSKPGMYASPDWLRATCDPVHPNVFACLLGMLIGSALGSTFEDLCPDQVRHVLSKGVNENTIKPFFLTRKDDCHLPLLAVTGSAPGSVVQDARVGDADPALVTALEYVLGHILYDGTRRSVTLHEHEPAQTNLYQTAAWMLVNAVTQRSHSVGTFTDVSALSTIAAAGGSNLRQRLALAGASLGLAGGAAAFPQQWRDAVAHPSSPGSPTLMQLVRLVSCHLGVYAAVQ